MAKRRSGLERIISGLGFGALAILLYSFHIGGSWILPLGLLLGTFSVLGGLRRTVREIGDRRQARLDAIEGRQALELERKESLEKTILQIAKTHGGVVTPAHVVLESDLKLEEAEKALQNLASRGYAEMRVKDNGTIDYVFHGLN